MSKTERDDVDWATAAEQASEDDEAQEGNSLEHDELSVEPAEHRAVHIVDDEGNYVYRFPAGDDDAVSAAGFTTSCLKRTKGTFTVVISNLPTGDIQVLDADYRFRVTGSTKP